MKCCSRTSFQAGQSHHMCSSSSSTPRSQCGQTLEAMTLALANLFPVQNVPQRMLLNKPLFASEIRLEHTRAKVALRSIPNSIPSMSFLRRAAAFHCTKRTASRISCCHCLTLTSNTFITAPVCETTYRAEGQDHPRMNKILWIFPTGPSQLLLCLIKVQEAAEISINGGLRCSTRCI